ncbi:MAG: aldo/keto reductase [Elusimicrobia bacterium]|nr:aldo/keto reductase [Elusimicrobiota bacterium]
MRYRHLGRTGLKISELCLGCMTFGPRGGFAGGVDLGTAKKMVGLCLDRGVNFFDTADIYTGGESERMLARALGGRRQKIVIATKVRWPVRPADGEAGLSRRHILRAVEESLRRLQTDWIDLYQVHSWDPLTPLEETLGVLDNLVRAGKVRYIGCSNFLAWQLAKSLWISDKNGWSRFETVQNEYSLLERQFERELQPLCRDQGVGLLAWSPLRGGMLSGKYGKDGPPPPGGRLSKPETQFPKPNGNRDYAMVEVLGKIAGLVARPPAALALRWLLSRPGVCSVILGARTLEQLRENLTAADMELPPEYGNSLDRAGTILKVT